MTYLLPAPQEPAKAFPLFAQNYLRWAEVENFFSGFSSDVPDLRIGDYLKGRVLDIGCGCGYMVKHLQERGIDCYGLERDEKTAVFARSTARRPEKIILADARRMPFPDNSFGLVASTMIYDHQNVSPCFVGYEDFLKRASTPGYMFAPLPIEEDPRENMKKIKEEALRVTRPGGFYFVQDSFHDSMGINKFFEGFERLNDSNCFIALRKPTHPTLPTK
ncbi:MAG: class I SAM-dependent methyltransferase [Candidatus Aenigmatarchaeota archaeon]